MIAYCAECQKYLVIKFCKFDSLSDDFFSRQENFRFNTIQLESLELLMLFMLILMSATSKLFLYNFSAPHVYETLRLSAVAQIAGRKLFQQQIKGKSLMIFLMT